MIYFAKLKRLLFNLLILLFKWDFCQKVNNSTVGYKYSFVIRDEKS